MVDRFETCKLALIVWILSSATLVLTACSQAQKPTEVLKGPEDPAYVAVNSFLDEYYKGRARNLSAFLDRYTDWPDFGPGDSMKVARQYSIRLVKQTDAAAQFEVTFRAVGEASLGKVDIQEEQDVLTYNLEKRQNGWRIVEPIHMPYISVTAEIEALKSFDDYVSKKLEAGTFTALEPESYLQTAKENISKSLLVLRRYQ